MHAEFLRTHTNNQMFTDQVQYLWSQNDSLKYFAFIPSVTVKLGLVAVLAIQVYYQQ